MKKYREIITIGVALVGFIFLLLYLFNPAMFLGRYYIEQEVSIDVPYINDDQSTNLHWLIETKVYDREDESTFFHSYTRGIKEYENRTDDKSKIKEILKGQRLKADSVVSELKGVNRYLK